MGIALLFLIALAAAAVIVYPLISGENQAQQVVAVSDEDIAKAVKAYRRSTAGPKCPSCGDGYQPGDRFCVHCGANLPTSQNVPTEYTCPTCEHPIQRGDRFCAKCGRNITLAKAT